MSHGDELTGDDGSSVPLLWTEANHDLRQPLQALVFITRSLAQTLHDPKQQEQLRYMQAALKGLQTKLDLLTDLSRIESGKSIPTLRSCSLAEVCESLLPEMSALAAAHGVRMRAKLALAPVTSDMTLLTLLVRSLLLNALKLCNPGDLLIGCRRRAERVRLEIYFRGVPVSEVHGRGAFVQLLIQKDDPTTSEVGLGLGFMAHLGRSLDHALESKSLSRDGVRLALSLPHAR
jgi:signal transduction histidine kinase